MLDYKLGEIEMRFADLVWNNEPVPSGELVKLAQKELSWKKSTTYTILRKIFEKGIFQNENGSVSSLVSKEEYKAVQSTKFVEKTFSGSLPKFLTAFAMGKKMSEKEIQEYAIAFVLLARLLLKKTPKIFSYALWALALFRLLCPFTFESAISALPSSAAPIPQNIVHSEQPQINTGLDLVDNAVNPILPSPHNIGDGVNPIRIFAFTGRSIWIIGIAALLIYSIAAFIKLKRSLTGSTPFRDNIYLVDHMNSPFVMGFIKPKIYLPSSLSNSAKDFIIVHEMHHIKRFDYITRILAFIALTVHWFNPIVWIAFILSGKDMEMSCDEALMSNPKNHAASSDVEPLCIKGTSVTALWKNRTEYVGNNSAVGNILSELSFPGNMAYDHFELKTDKEPYGITVYFNAAGNALTEIDENEIPFNHDFDEFETNAKIMFSLIGNVDEITFVISKGNAASRTSHYQREDYDDVFNKTRTLEEFMAVLKELLDSGILSLLRKIKDFQDKAERDFLHFHLFKLLHFCNKATKIILKFVLFHNGIPNLKRI